MMTITQLRESIRGVRDKTKHPLGAAPPVFPVWVVAQMATRFMKAAELLTEVRNDSLWRKDIGQQIPYVASKEDYQVVIDDLEKVVDSLCSYLRRYTSMGDYPDIGWITPLSPVADIWGDVALVINDGTKLDFKLVADAHQRLVAGVAEAWKLMAKV